MGRIFIIGNGYDQARRGDTSYFDFKEWLLSKYPQQNTYIYDYYDFQNKQIKIGNIKKISSFTEHFLKSICGFNEKNLSESEIDLKREAFAASILLFVMTDDNLWRCFEESLGKLEPQLNKMIENASVGREKLPGSPVSYFTSVVSSLSSSIKTLFSSWVTQLPSTKECDVVKKGFEKEIIKEIEDNDLFIVFNYTTTLEDLFDISDYQQNKICHIHGIKFDKNSITVGHSNNEINGNTPLNTENDYIQEFLFALNKRTDVIINNKTKLWNEIYALANTNEPLDIYEFGWSCDSPDTAYLEKICYAINDNMDKTTLWLNNYDNGGSKKAENWRKAGFKGVVKYYEEDKEGNVVEVLLPS